MMQSRRLMEVYMCDKKYSKILLSHSGKDKAYGDAIVSFLLSNGFRTEQILYSSSQDCGIPNGLDIFDYLRDAIKDKIYVIYLLSENYYESVACMNEMGAAWVCQNESFLAAVPGFNFSDSRFQGSVLNPRKLVVLLDNEIRMKNFIQDVADLFGIETDDIHMKASLQEFLAKIHKIKADRKAGYEKKQGMTGAEVLAKETKLTVSGLLELGEKLWKEEKNYAAALQQCLCAIWLEENYEQAYNQAVAIATYAGDYPTARRISDEAIRRFPQSAEVYGNRGYLECEGKRYAEAIAYCDQANLLVPNRWFYNTKGRVLLRQGKLLEALDNFWEAHSRSPQYVPALENISEVCRRMGIEEVLECAMKKKKQNDLKACRRYLECVLIADKENITAAEELKRL